MRATRYFSAVDSHTEGMPTRVITGGLGAGARRDDAGAPAVLRAQPGRPAAAADARAARPLGDVGGVPAAADAPGRRLGRAVRRGLRAAADVRPRDDRRGHGAGRERDGRGHRARDASSGSTRRPGWSRRRSTVARRPRRAGDAAQRARVRGRRSTPRSRSTGSGRSATTWRSAATSTRSWRPTRSGSIPFRPARQRADRRRAGDRRRDQPRVRARSTRSTRRSAAASTSCSTAAATTARTPATPPRSIRAGSTARPCGTGTSARMAALHARGELALGEEFVNESVIGSRFIGRLVRRPPSATLPGVIPEVSGPGLDHRDGPVPARPDRSVPDRASRCERAASATLPRLARRWWSAAARSDCALAEALASRGARRDRARARPLRRRRLGRERRLDHAVAGDPGARTRRDRQVAAVAGEPVRSAVDPARRCRPRCWTGSRGSSASCPRSAYQRGLVALQRAAALAGPAFDRARRARRRVRAPRRSRCCIPPSTRPSSSCC